MRFLPANTKSLLTFLFAVLPVSLCACDDGPAVDEETPVITRSVFEVWSQPDEQGVKQVFFGAAHAKHTHPSTALQVTVGSTDSSDAATIFAPTTEQFIVVYANESAPGHAEVRAVAIDPSFKAGVSPYTVVAAPVVSSNSDEASRRTSFGSPHGVWVASKQAAFVVFATQTAVFHAWVRPVSHAAPQTSEAMPLTPDRPGRVSHPTVAYATATDRLMVAWGIMRSQEDIELGVMSPNDKVLSTPSRRSWRHKQRECNMEMAPACIEGGDRPALAYHEGLRAFGLAVADDLNDGSRVEGFLVRDDCGPLSCDVIKVGFDDNTKLPEDQRERFLIEVDRVASVSIAPVDDGFMVDFAYGGDGPYRPAALGTVAFDGNCLKRTTQAIR